MSRTYAPAAGRRGPRPARLLLSLALLATLGTPGCGKGDKNYEITDVREKKVAGPMAPETTLAQRLGAEHGAGNGAEAPGDGAGGRMWAYTTPPGWMELPPAPMRDLGWGVAGNPDAECTFSTLPKGGGGLASNVNRWRKQMSLPPLDDAAVQALPKKNLLGRPATLVELSGVYVGMGGPKTLDGAKLLGLIADLPMASAFLKLKGPAAVVDAETAHFYELAASIGMRKAGDPAPHEPTAGPSLPEPAPDAGAPFQWTAPEGWVKGPEKSMRLVTYLPAKAPKSSCYVSVLGGAAGGAKANIDRWADQMGLPALTDDAFEKLDRKTVLGKPAVFCALEGTFGGMGGGEKQAGWVMLGMVLERGDDVVFVKMTGPVDEIAGEKANFRAFCESFHE